MIQNKNLVRAPTWHKTMIAPAKVKRPSLVEGDGGGRVLVVEGEMSSVVDVGREGEETRDLSLG